MITKNFVYFKLWLGLCKTADQGVIFFNETTSYREFARRCLKERRFHVLSEFGWFTFQHTLHFNIVYIST